MIVFRRRFTGPAGVVRVSADQRFQLFLNGRRVAEGPGRGDLAHWPYRAVDLGPFLRPGENELRAVVWSYGRWAPMAQHTARPAFVLDGSGLETPDGWEVAHVPGRDFDMLQSAILPFYIDVGPGEIRFSSLPDELAETGLDWAAPNLVSAAEEIGALSGGTPWSLVESTLPPMRRDPRAAPPRVRPDDGAGAPLRLPLEITPDGPLTLDFGELLAAYPRFKFSPGRPAQVRIVYGESFFGPDGNKGHRDEIVGKRLEGYCDEIRLGIKDAEFEPLWWRTFRYLQLHVDGPVTLTGLGVEETGYPLRRESQFRAAPDWVAEVADVAWRTAERCAGETYFDCPYYEQLQYVGDTRVQALIGYYAGRDRRLTRQAVRQFAESVTPDGLTQSRYPSRQPQTIPPFSLWWVLMVADQWAYDSSELARTYVPACRRVLDAVERLAEAPPGFQGWPFADWVPSWPMGVPPGGLNASVHHFTRLLATARLAEVADDDALADRARAELAQIRQVDGMRYHPSDPAQAPSEHAEALYRLAQSALGVTPDPWPEVWPEGTARTTYYFSYYRHLAQRPLDYAEEMAPWREMIADGLTTFAENPEPTRSDCHAWSSHPLLGFWAHVAGVTSAGPDWARARIAPQSTGFEPFRAVIAHPQGEIVVSVNPKGRLLARCPVPFELAWRGATQTLPAGRYAD